MKKKRIVNKELLKEVASQPCAVGENCLGDVIAEHVTTKGSGGDDVPENIMPLCVKHHDEKGKGYSYMIRRYDGYVKWLTDHGREDIFEQARWIDKR